MVDNDYKNKLRKHSSNQNSLGSQVEGNVILPLVEQTELEVIPPGAEPGNSPVDPKSSRKEVVEILVINMEDFK